MITNKTKIKTTFDEILNGKLKIFQPKKGYRVGTDAIILAASINPKKGDLLDLGSGVGAISLAVLCSTKNVKIFAVEKDQLSFELLKENIKINGFDNYIVPLFNDIRKLPNELKGCFDYVFSNPPFHKKNKNISFYNRKNLGYYDDNISLSKWIEIAVWACRIKGRITLIVRTDRADEVIVTLKKMKVGEIILFPIYSFLGDKAVRVIITGRLGVDGGMAILNGFTLYNENGTLTDAAQRVMNGAKINFKHPNAKHLNY